MPLPSRAERLSTLTRKPFDLLVIGGGVTGCGIARDAVRRGLSVALVEAQDIAFGTSSRSSKLIHGGLRYLENYEFSLVFEAVSERRKLMNIAPHLVHPMGFIFPVFEDSRVGIRRVSAGMWLYEGLALFRTPQRHRMLSVEELQREEPMIGRPGLRGAPLYYDCATDDARLTLETVLDAVEEGAVVATYCRVTGLVRDEQGRVRGAHVRDELGRRDLEIRATVVINATGPWTDRTRALGGAARPLLRPTKGIHIVVDRGRLPLNHAVVCLHPTDKRVLFAIPWGERTYIGTTDTDFEGDPGRVRAEAEDVLYLLEAANDLFPSAALQPDHVISTWAGVRPLIFEEAESASAVSREHQIVVDEDGLITVAGGKLTTYRRMAAEVVTKALEMMALVGALLPHIELDDPMTGRTPLPGAAGWPEEDDAETVVDEVLASVDRPLDRSMVTYLVHTYGVRALPLAVRLAEEPRLAEPLVPGRPEPLGIVEWAVREELAETVRDVLIRRSQIFFRDDDQGCGAAEAVAGEMARLLGWSAQRRTEEVLAYLDEVARSRAWRDELPT